MVDVQMLAINFFCCLTSSSSSFILKWLFIMCVYSKVPTFVHFNFSLPLTSAHWALSTQQICHICHWNTSNFNTFHFETPNLQFQLLISVRRLWRSFLPPPPPNFNSYYVTHISCHQISLISCDRVSLNFNPYSLWNSCDQVSHQFQPLLSVRQLWWSPPPPLPPNFNPYSLSDSCDAAFFMTACWSEAESHEILLSWITWYTFGAELMQWLDSCVVKLESKKFSWTIGSSGS